MIRLPLKKPRPKKIKTIDEMNVHYINAEQTNLNILTKQTIRIHNLLQLHKFSKLYEILKRAIEQPSIYDLEFRRAFFEEQTQSDGVVLGKFLDYLEEHDEPFFRKIAIGFMQYFSVIYDRFRLQEYGVSEEFMKQIYPRVYYAGIAVIVKQNKHNFPTNPEQFLATKFVSAGLWGVPKEDIIGTINIFTRKGILTEKEAKFILRYFNS